jgi:phosphatidylserine synthase
MAKKENDLNFWRVITDFWGVITALAFIIAFFNVLDLNEPLRSMTIIYVSILSIYAGVKEFTRWKEKNFVSRHNGEIFIFFWTILVIIFVVLSAYNPDKYRVPGELTGTYLSILGVFAISRKSKALKIK